MVDGKLIKTQVFLITLIKTQVAHNRSSENARATNESTLATLLIEQHRGVLPLAWNGSLPSIIDLVAWLGRY